FCKILFRGSGSLGNVQSHLSFNHLSLQSGGEELQVHIELFKSLNRFRLQYRANILAAYPSIRNGFEREFLALVDRVACQEIGDAAAYTARFTHLVDENVHLVL